MHTWCDLLLSTSAKLSQVSVKAKLDKHLNSAWNMCFALKPRIVLILNPPTQHIFPGNSLPGPPTPLSPIPPKYQGKKAMPGVVKQPSVKLGECNTLVQLLWLLDETTDIESHYRDGREFLQYSNTNSPLTVMIVIINKRSLIEFAWLEIWFEQTNHQKFN